jgi:SAM-dependent methyltransferase
MNTTIPVIENSTIEDLYTRYVKIHDTPEYRNQYVPLPVTKNNKKWKWEGKDFPRIISLLEFEKYIQKYNFNINDLLIFNGENDPELEYLEGRIKNIHHGLYEQDTFNYDLHRFNLPKKDYDFICLHQTLEHVYNPYQCLVNIKKHLTPDGYVYINVPACNIPHSDPFHYYTGYTSMGLTALAHQAGFKILEIGQWGNTEYLVNLFTRQPGWSDYTQLSNPGLNEFYNPVITWGLFQNQ